VTNPNLPHYDLGYVGEPTAAVPKTCVFCEEELDGTDTAEWPIGTSDGPRQAHRQCMLRSTLGGIGHLIAHPYWCTEHNDPDAGLSYRHSAQLVEAYVHIIGVGADR